MRCQCGEEFRRIEDTMHVCSVCGKDTKVVYACPNGHSMCAECVEPIIRRKVKEICKSSTSRNPRTILDSLLSCDIISERKLRFHLITAPALVAAYRNSGGEIDMDEALDEVMRRGSLIPPKACGHAGNCGSATSAGIFFSVVAGTHPLKEENWGQVHMLTGKCLMDLGSIGGPRCCNRGVNIAMRNAVGTVKDALGVEMEWIDVKCHGFGNDVCIGSRCPYNDGSH